MTPSPEFKCPYCRDTGRVRMIGTPPPHVPRCDAGGTMYQWCPYCHPEEWTARALECSTGPAAHCDTGAAP